MLQQRSHRPDQLLLLLCEPRGLQAGGERHALERPVRLESAGSLPPRDDEALAAEERINRYFRQKVVPKLWSCWKDLKGEGVVTIQHDYIRRADGNWIPYSLRVIGSSLSRDQNEIAIKCMNQTAQGTSFSSDKWDGEDRDLALVWSWPVPYPD